MKGRNHNFLLHASLHRLFVAPLILRGRCLNAVFREVVGVVVAEQVVLRAIVFPGANLEQSLHAFVISNKASPNERTPPLGIPCAYGLLVIPQQLFHARGIAVLTRT